MVICRSGDMDLAAGPYWPTGRRGKKKETGILQKISRLLRHESRDMDLAEDTTIKC